MAGDGSDDFEPKEAVVPLPPRREPPLIEGKAEPEEEAELGEPANRSGQVFGSDAAGKELPADPPVQTMAPPPKKSGGAALPLSILFGAAIAAGGAFGLHYYDTSSSAVGQFQSRLDELTEKTDALSGLSGKLDSLSAANTALTEKVATLETAVNAPPEQAQKTEPDQAFGDLEKRLSALEASGAAASKPAEGTGAGPSPDAGLQIKVAALEDAVAASAKANAGLADEVQKLAEAQKAFSEKPSASPAPVNLSPLDTRLSKLEGKLAPVEAALAEAKSDIRAVQEKQAVPPPMVNLGPVDARLSKLEEKVAPIETALAAAKTDISAVQDKQAAFPPAQDQNAAIVAITLLQRVQQGLPYETELSALGNLNIDPAKLSLLKASAAKGVASVRSLSEEFRELAPSLIKESEKSPPGQSFIDRLADDAAHLVRIERMGDQTSTDVPSLINRIETALDQNDVEAAYSLWVHMPQGEKALSASFGTALKTRLDSVAVSWSIASESVANLSKSKS